MPYNPVTGEYELEVKIKLNKTGLYSQEAATHIYVYIPGNGICNKFILDTNIVGMNQYGNIEFEVLP